MNLKIQNSKFKIQNATIAITGSKSETNRLLLLQALYPNISIENASNSDDSEVMVEALQKSKIKNQKSFIIDVHHAGTAMRFLTAFFAIQEGVEVILTGSSRMKERPIQILVDALNQLGAEITYIEKEGFPPIKIVGKKLIQSRVSLPANVSSQFVSALLLIAPKLENGLELTLEGAITSRPYIQMTLDLLGEIGVETSFVNNSIKIPPKPFIESSKSIHVESDWSSASYFYSIVALSEIDTEITLSNFKKNSLQGDSVLVEIYENFGVETVFNSDNSITISKISNFKPDNFNFHLNSTPDIAQTIAVTCFGLGIECKLTGLHTLKIKETDRLEALKNELTPLGASVQITEDSISIQGFPNVELHDTNIKTYQDHRMAMAFAPLAIKMPLTFANAEVVSKSYPAFWSDLKSLGFQVAEI
ncbi:3-phosphoshikimate 1-carboxyvinyltransferase [Flavobacterium sp.]|uniref:3-phosphoshikimate 1-carboxyvinyltransferase n=1 Tax=Flavobacterium sp. TaxID=239 RepID=UPI0038CF96FA